MISINNHPEILALIGVPQPIEWHPEGDAYNHTMLVASQAKLRYPHNERVFWGAICHDLGKALTQATWPKHYGHADKGVVPTKALLQRIGFDEEFIKDVCFMTKYHMHIHDAFKLKATTLIRIYKDAGGDYDLLEDFSKLGVCDHYGRGGIDINDYHANPFHMLACFRIIHGYPMDTLLTSSLKSIIHEIKKLRGCQDGGK